MTPPPRFLFHKEREHHDAITEELAQLLPRFSCFVVSPGSLKVGEAGERAAEGRPLRAHTAR